MSTSYTNAQAVDLSSTDWTAAALTSAQALVAGAAGNVKVDTQGGSTGVVIAVAAGVPIPLRVVKIYKTGTTATGIAVLS
jgi:hypothetical protein